jgi:hypothetical protein
MALGDVLYQAKKKTHEALVMGRQAADKRSGSVKAAFRKIVPFLIAALVIVLVVPIVMLFFANRQKTEEAATQAQKRTMFTGLSIPKEDLYLPDEPDYLPPAVIRERERSWSPEKAGEWWTNPANIGDDRMIERVRDDVNAILDKVP